ncbi:hypothetical protein KIN20_027007 [Parelaphostrongylus tenuis]|uniref:Uncharacterized protein n=1 Tax=Parelaphostrongylus tenuis TaxID=148309 RepID=A0AAD5WDM3_PARTN|nr:hypothetical protein KIN20_027007 [Parelaphostrongylus tenuis]
MVWRLGRARRVTEDVFVKLLIVAFVGSIIYLTIVQTFDIYRYRIAGELGPSKSEPPRVYNISKRKLEVFIVPFTHPDPGEKNKLFGQTQVNAFYSFFYRMAKNL